jgi:hypothetical protein
MIAEGVDRPRERAMMDEGPAAGGVAMQNPPATDRKPVTSDPDRGVAVNSETDPQRPRKPARPAPEASAEKSTPIDDSRTTHPPSTNRNEDVEHGGRNEPDDAL